MKYIPSIAFEEMSGSAKGVTAAKMKSRKYIRNRGYGGSVRTADQAKVKGVFKRLTTMWKSLTPAQILAWNKLALSQEGRSVLGSKAKISGANLFTRLNYWIVACGGQPSVTPPELVGVENPSSATIVCQGETFTFKLDQALADNGGIYLVIEATEGQSNGVTRAHATTSVRTTWPSTAPPALRPRRSSSATTTSTPAPARSPALCWQKSSGPLQRPVAVSRSLRD